MSLGHNISSDSSCPFDKPGDLVNTDPLLGPLADNGGLTQTQALLGGSPAIDAGSKNCTVFDQRGTVRPIDGNKDGKAVCDVGATEAAAGGVATFQVTEFTPTVGGNAGRVTVLVRGNGFKPGAQVKLLNNGATVLTALTSDVQSPGKIVAKFPIYEPGHPIRSASKSIPMAPVGSTQSVSRSARWVGDIVLDLLVPGSHRPGNKVHYIP